MKPVHIISSWRSDCVQSQANSELLAVGKKYDLSSNVSGVRMPILKVAASLNFDQGHDDIAVLKVSGGESMQSFVRLDDGSFSKEGSVQTLYGYVLEINIFKLKLNHSL